MNFKSPKLFNNSIVYLMLILFSVFACQDEVSEISNPNNQETITENSSLATLIQNITTLDGSLDNIIDSANCILINLPVTVEINGVAFVIDSIEDYQVIEAIFDEFDTDEDDIEIIFPITITLNDYTQVVITNYNELETFIDECSGENEDDDDIECIDFQYPITFSIYDANFQVIETITINNDEALYNFIENLEGGVLASLNFPVTMILSDGSSVVVNNNQELETVISEADDDCDEDDDNDWNDDDCSQEDIALALQECIWNIVNYNGDTGSITNKDFNFINDNTFTVSINGNVVHEGTWAITENNGAFMLTFITPWDDIDGSWTIVECDDDRLQLVNAISNIVMEQDCDTSTNNPFDCFAGEDFELTECSDTGFAIFNLTEAWSDCINPSNFNITYHESLSDAQQDFGAIANPQTYTATSNPQTIYIRVESFNNANEFQVYEIHLNSDDCNTSGCTTQQVIDYLQTCTWNVTQYSGTGDLSDYDLQFNDNDELILTNAINTYTGIWMVNDNNGTPTIMLNIPAPNIQALSGTWELVECDDDRLQFSSATSTFVIEQDCTDADGCNLNEVQTNLMDCEWIISSYNNDSGFNIFNIDFQTNGQAIIYTPNSTEDYTANWIVSFDGNIYLDFSNISGGNVQVLEGNFILVECTPNQLIFHDPSNTNIELILDKDCN